jgi:hypothetical protein
VSDEQAKATQAVAKATEKGLDTADKFGGFLDRVFGDLMADGVGVVADRVKVYRWEKSLELQDRVEKILADRGVAGSRPVAPKIGVRLIEEASIADDDSVSRKWANLLANAMDPSYSGPIKRSYVSILADMEPIDVHLLDVVAKEHGATPEAQREGRLYDREKIAIGFGRSVNEIEVSLRNLLRLGLIKPGTVKGGLSFGSHQVSAYRDTELFDITLSGLELYRAVSEV